MFFEELVHCFGVVLLIVVVLLDGYGGFDDVFEVVDNGCMLDWLECLVVEGLVIGLYFVIIVDWC